MLRDRACRVGLGLDSQSVKSTSVDAVTSRIYKIKKKGFQVVTSVSPDGKYFPSRPAEFIEEARSQAQETYGLRSLHCEVHRIREAADRVRARHLVRDSLSVHDFFLNFFSGQGRRLAVRIIGDSSPVPCVTLEEWFWVLQKSGSEATALDEMCESLLQALSSCGHQALVCWLKKLREGHFSYFLQTAIHICLLKKVPTWLLRNSRPIVIGPVLRRRESTLVFTKLLSRAEVSGFMPPWAYAYRKQFTPHLLGIFLRYFIAFWAIKSPDGIWVTDWDESNAFCNVIRHALAGLLLSDPALEHIGRWVDWFFSSTLVTLQTPFGLSPPYYLLQGGIQGDSMGVGGYLIPRVLRSWALRDEVSGPPHPCIDGETVPEVIFSDDGRQMSLSSEEMTRNLDLSYELAVLSGGSVNISKLALYRIKLQDGGLVYMNGDLSCCLGTAPLSLSGLKTVGIPCVMGEPPTAILAASRDSLRRVLAKIRRERPSCILALRVTLAYAVSSIDYSLSLVPLTSVQLHSLQVQVKQAARSALSVPSWFPSRWLLCPLRHGGLGFPNLFLRLRLQRVLHTVLAAQSRSIYTSSLVRGLLFDPVWHALPGSDPLCFRADCDELSLALCVDPCQELPASEVKSCWLRSELQPPFTMVSDGAARRHALGFAAVLVDAAGIAAYFWCHARVWDSSSWLAEWLGKLLAVEQAVEAGALQCLLLGDNLSAAINDGPTRSSSSHFIDCIMRAVAGRLALGHFTEGFVPSQHVSGWTGFVSAAQALAHELASVPAGLVVPPSIPFLHALQPQALLLREGMLCVSPREVLQQLYDNQMVPVVLQPMPGASRSSLLCSNWEAQVSELTLSNDDIRVCMWLRSSSVVGQAPSSAYCPFCGAVVGRWAQHFASGCLHVWVSVAAAFRTLILDLLSHEWTVQSFHLYSASVTKGGRRLDVRLRSDVDHHPAIDVLWVSMSGLVSLQLPEGDSLSPIDVTHVSTVYIRALRSALSVEHVTDLLVCGLAPGLGSSEAIPWSLAVFMGFIYSLLGARGALPVLHVPDWARRPWSGCQVCWRPEGPLPEDETAIVLSPEWVGSSMDTVLRLDGLWVVQWNNPVGTADYPELMDQLARC